MKKGMDELQEYRRMRQALLTTAELKLKDDPAFIKAKDARDNLIEEIRKNKEETAKLQQKAQIIAVELERIQSSVIPEEYRERR